MQLVEDPKDSVIQEDISDAFNIVHCLSAILIHLLYCLMAHGGHGGSAVKNLRGRKKQFRIRFVPIRVLYCAL
jgi:hypothetical protein